MKESNETRNVVSGKVLTFPTTLSKEKLIESNTEKAEGGEEEYYETEEESEIDWYLYG